VLMRTLGDLSIEPIDATIGATLRAYLADDQRPGTVAHDARQLRELATAVRDQLSGDTWAVLARLERALEPLRPPQADPVGIPGVVTVVLEALLAFAGLAAESMVRDVGWHLLDAGRRVERALQVSRLLRGCLVAEAPIAVEDLVVESALVAAESIITHRRRYGARAGVETVLSLLLFDRDNPRAVAYQVDQLGIDLRRIAGHGPVEDELADRLLRIGALLQQSDATELATVRDGGRAALDELLTRLIETLHGVAEAIASTHFPAGGQLQSYPGLDPVGSFEPA
jgi:uncharacterized alpha-E superfamily protein